MSSVPFVYEVYGLVSEISRSKYHRIVPLVYVPDLIYLEVLRTLDKCLRISSCS